jgi:ATP-dependent RNA helicase SUPV3L1/SUV3
LLAAAEKRLGTERSRRAEALIATGQEALTLVEDRLVWEGHGVARLVAALRWGGRWCGWSAISIA